MATRLHRRQRGPSGDGGGFLSGRPAPEKPPEKCPNHQDQSKEQLIAELETIEQRLTAQRDELRQTTLLLASAEQRERDRLGRILHDDLQQVLLAAKWNLRSLKKQLRTNRHLYHELSHAIQMVDRSIEMSRSISRDLSPPSLDSGLLPAIDSLEEHLRTACGFRIKVTVEGEFSSIPDALRDFLYQAIRELLINAAKHSHRTDARLCLTDSGNSVEVAVSDDGVGFDLKGLDHVLQKGSGLLRIWTRTNRMGGQLSIEASPGAGATFRLSIPRSGEHPVKASP